MKKTFEQWMAEVNKLVSNTIGGLDTEDLPDQPYMDWYEDGVHPKTAAKRALKDAGWGRF